MNPISILAGLRLRPAVASEPVLVRFRALKEISNNPPPPPPERQRSFLHSWAGLEARQYSGGTHSGPRPRHTAEVVLSNQVRDLASALKDGGSAAGSRAMAVLQARGDRAQPLTLATAQRLLTVLQPPPNGQSVQPAQPLHYRTWAFDSPCPGGPSIRQAHALQQQREQALGDITRGLIAELRLHATVDELTTKMAPLAHAGTSDVRSANVRLGGLLGIANATLGVSVGRMNVVGDDRCLVQINACTGEASAGVPAIRANLAGSTGQMRIWDNMGEKVQWQALQQQGTGYITAISAALRWQDVPLLPPPAGSDPAATLSTLGEVLPAFTGNRVIPYEGRIRTCGAQLQFSTDLSPATLGIASGAEHVEMVTGLPTAVTAPDGKGDSLATADPMVQAALARRMCTLLAELAPQAVMRSPALASIWQLHTDHPAGSSPLRPEALRQQCHRAVMHLETELALLEDAHQKALAGVPGAQSVVASMVRPWGASAKAMDRVLITQLDCVGWLQAFAATHGIADKGMQARTHALAQRILATHLPHSPGQVQQATHAYERMTQKITSYTLMVNAGVGLAEGLGAGISVEVARRERQDPDPLRAGVYWEVTLGVQARGQVNGVLTKLLPLLAPHGGLPAAELAGLVTQTESLLEANGAADCVVRLFKPAFQREAGFPPTMARLQLQHIRQRTQTTQSAEVTAPVPISPGVLATLGAGIKQQQLRIQGEWLNPGSLTGILRRFQSLASEYRSPERAWAAMEQAQPGIGAALERLLRDPDSPPFQEALYLLNGERAQAGGTPLTALPALSAQALLHRLLPAVSRLSETSALKTRPVLK